MSPITANSSPFSNSAELLGLRGGIFPTLEVRLLFKDLSYSNLQRPIFDSLTYHMKTHPITSWKTHPILLVFSVPEFKNLGRYSTTTLLFSNARSNHRSKPYTKKPFYPGNRGIRPHPQVAQTFNVIRIRLTRTRFPAHVSSVPRYAETNFICKHALNGGTPRSPA